MSQTLQKLSKIVDNDQLADKIPVPIDSEQSTKGKSFKFLIILIFISIIGNI